ncbi:MAG: hypothetical protein OEM04_03530 [Flavobacteriaceae bacterium]|nr:hypothetical protein [Flavobacteriaceae bacterium]
MKTEKKPILIASILFMTAIWTFAAVVKGTDLLKGIDLYVFILIIIIGIIALYKANKKEKELKEGVALEDELTLFIKYKSGYISYMITMYLWLFIFLFKDKFNDTETMLGSGILLSALISLIVKFAVKHKLND